MSGGVGEAEADVGGGCFGRVGEARLGGQCR